MRYETGVDVNNEVNLNENFKLFFLTVGDSDLNPAFEEVAVKKTELSPNPVVYKVPSH